MYILSYLAIYGPKTVMEVAWLIEYNVFTKGLFLEKYKRTENDGERQPIFQKTSYRGNEEIITPRGCSASRPCEAR